MPTARINGADLYYAETGEGIPCIALHGGLGFDHSYFASAFAVLEDTIHFVYLDQRGHGRSKDVPLDTITIPQLADDVDALRDHLGPERVAVLGHSYGGFVALEYATRYPHRLTHLFALDTSPGVFEPTADELAARPDPSSIRPEAVEAKEPFAWRRSTTREEFTARVERLVPAYLRSAPPGALAGVLTAAISSPAAMARGLEVLPGWSVDDRLDRITCPTLVTCGRYDLFTTPECSARIASRVPGAELVWFENSGHFPWVEEPDAFFGAVKSFIATHP